jgi:hypothetical protein
MTLNIVLHFLLYLSFSQYVYNKIDKHIGKNTNTKIIKYQEFIIPYFSHT